MRFRWNMVHLLFVCVLIFLMYIAKLTGHSDYVVIIGMTAFVFIGFYYLSLQLDELKKKIDEKVEKS